MTEAQEVAAAFIAGAAGFPALLWLAHNAERRIRNGWEKTLENMALAADPQDWTLAERYIREGTPPDAAGNRRSGAGDKDGNILGKHLLRTDTGDGRSRIPVPDIPQRRNRGGRICR